MMDVLVVTVDDPLTDDSQRPVSEARIREVADGGRFFSGEEDRAIARWLLKVSVTISRSRA